MAENRPRRSAGGLALRIGLFVLLGLLLVALVVDRNSLSESQAAYDAISAQLQGGDAQMTPEQAREVIKREPEGGLLQENNHRYELYEWPAGLPWNSYQLYVVYQGEEDSPVVSYVSYNQLPQFLTPDSAPLRSDLPEPKEEEEEPADNEATEEEPAPDAAAEPQDSDDEAEPREPDAAAE